MPNLEALSALARGWVDDSIDQVGTDLLARRGLGETATRPVVIAGVSDSVWGEAVIKRAMELACDDDADLLVVHARVADGGGATRDDVLDHYRDMSLELGGSYSEVGGESPAQALAEVARARSATKVVVARHRSRLSELARGSVASQLRRLLPDTTLEEVRELA